MAVPQDKIAEELVKLYQQAISRLQSELITIDPRQIGKRRHLYTVLRHIEDELTGLDQSAAAWIKANVLTQYRSGAAEGARQVKALGITKVSTMFSLPHRQMAKHLAEGFYYDFHRLVDQNQNSLINFVRRAHISERERTGVLQAVARGGLEGRAVPDVTGDILKALSSSVVDNKIAIGNVTYKGDYYAKLLARTHLRVAATRGTQMRLIEHKIDLVQISAHGTICNICKPFENKVFSNSGGSSVYPPIALLANGGPPFHPFCLHVISGFIPALKDKTEIARAQWVDVDPKQTRIDKKVLSDWKKRK